MQGRYALHAPCTAIAPGIALRNRPWARGGEPVWVGALTDSASVAVAALPCAAWSGPDGSCEAIRFHRTREKLLTRGTP